ncbi:MAG TPA: MBL fold metallo-hydrolase [Candidatus Binatia bacterium]
MSTTERRARVTASFFYRSYRLCFCLCLFWSLIPVPAAHATCREINVARGFPSPAYAAEFDATMRYLGHNFFHITTSKGTELATDPLGPGWYPDPHVSAHVVTVGREHFNHNYVEILRGNPMVLRGLNQFGDDWNRVSVNVREVFIYNIPLYQNGADGGYLKGAAFVFDLGSLCIAHLGDLSHPLTPQQIKLIGKIDIALTPIGGRFTMAPETAREVVAQLKPKIAIPMHYRDDLRRVEEFGEGYRVRYLDTDSIPVSKASLPSSTEIVVLRPYGAAAYE